MYDYNKEIKEWEKKYGKIKYKNPPESFARNEITKEDEKENGE